MHFYQLRRSILTTLFISGSYLYSSAQAVINLEPEMPAPVAALSKQPGLKSWYDKTSKMLCCMYNDQKAVYIQLAITDLLQQKKVIENGIELWIDSKGKKKKHTGLLFPLPASQPAAGHMPTPNESMPAFTPPTENIHPNDKEIRQQLIAQAMQQREMKVIGFNDELNGTQNAKHPSGLQASLQFNHDTLIYEAIIPFHTLAKPVSNNTTLTIGIIAKGMLPGNSGGNGMPEFDGPPDEMMPPPGPPPGEAPDDEVRVQLWKDDLIWYRYVVRG